MANIRPVTNREIIARIRLENSWWSAEGNFNEEAFLTPRLYFDSFFQQAVQVEPRRALILIGPRRVGKTVMLHQLMRRLAKEGTPSRKICYLPIDAPIFTNLGLEQLFELCRYAAGDTDPANFTIIFDEIQYLKQWEQHLKVLVDLYKDTRFIASGSAAAALRQKSNESGAGRFHDFLLPPLNFCEYLHLKGKEHLAIRFTKANPDWPVDEVQEPESFGEWQSLNSEFINYINFGGYPEIMFNEALQKNPARYLRNDIIEKVLLRDLPSLYGITDVQELNALFNVIAYNCGNEFNLEKLSQESSVSKVLIRKYLEYLETAFLIKIVQPVGFEARRFVRASRFKIFLSNPSMRCGLFSPVTPDDQQFGQMVETAVVAQYQTIGYLPELQYAAWKDGEVDFVSASKPGKPDWALEVKWSDQFFQQPGKLRSLLKFATEHDLKKVWSLTRSELGEKSIENLSIQFCPAALYCYVLGKSMLDLQKTEAKNPTNLHFLLGYL